MTEHMHVWRKWHPWCAVYRCVVSGCYENMSSNEVESRLNAIERLGEFRQEVDAMVNDGEPHEMGGPFISGNWFLERLDDILGGGAT